MFLEDFLSYIGFLLSLSPSFVVHVDSVSPLVSEFKSVVEACSLTQYIDFPTHLHGLWTCFLPLMLPMKFSSMSEASAFVAYPSDDIDILY